MTPIVTAGLTCPPVNGPAVEIPKNKNALTKNVQYIFATILEVGTRYYVAFIP